MMCLVRKPEPCGPQDRHFPLVPARRRRPDLLAGASSLFRSSFSNQALYRIRLHEPFCHSRGHELLWCAGDRVVRPLGAGNTPATRTSCFVQEFPGSVRAFAGQTDVVLREAFFRMARWDLFLRRNAFIHPWVWRCLPSATLRRRLLGRTTAVAVRRYAHYWEFLHAEGRKYDWVLLFDIRDVLWQADLCAALSEPGLHAFLEDESVEIGAEGDYNIQWLRLRGQQGAFLRGKVSSAREPSLATESPCFPIYGGSWT